MKVVMESIQEVAKLAQDEIDRDAATDPHVLKALGIVEKFIKSHRVMCYGGTAINNLLPPEDRFYDPQKDVPDYDFFSETPQIDAMTISDKLAESGFKSVETKPGVHLGTFKVFADYVGVADISHLDSEVFDKLWKERITKQGIHYVPPNFLRMSMYLELSRPKGDVSRWTKVYSRLQLLNKHYDMTCPASQVKLNDTYMTKDMKEDIEGIMKSEKVILLGFNGASLQRKGIHTKWMFPLDLLVVPSKRKEVSNRLKSLLDAKTGLNVKQKEHEAYAELLPAHTDILDEKTGSTLIRIYETDACHSFHKTSTGLMLASIPTLLQFFLATLYAPKHFLEDQPEQRFLCTAEQLVDLANNDLPRRYKLLTPITCLGTQKSLIDMKVNKNKLYQRLAQDKSSPEFLEFFFTYIPTSMDYKSRKTLRKDVTKALRKTQRRRR
jgi:hypothetical protein